jgi:hypothetical protein
MSDNVRKNRWLLAILVCVAGMVTGALFGALMGHSGTIWGGLGGLVAGLAWMQMMARHMGAKMAAGKFVLAGTNRGILVGVLATVILHGGMQLTDVLMHPETQSRNGFLELMPIVAIIAGLCAVVGGSVTGLICGYVAFYMTRSTAGGKNDHNE